MWFQAIKLAVSAGSKIYANKHKDERWQCLMHNLMHAERQWPVVRKLTR